MMRRYIMTVNKCNFCTAAGPDGKCFWSTHSARERDCEKAINKMMEILKVEIRSNNNKKDL